MTTKNSQKAGNLGKYKVGYKRPPKEHQFGAEKANPSHSGAWKKSDTLRYKLQQIAKMSEMELRDLLSSPEVGEFEKSVARTILEMPGLDPNKRWQVLEGLTNQDSGYPKQQVEQKNIELTPILPKPKKGEKNER